MTEQEALIREAIAAEADLAVDSGSVLAALHEKRSSRRGLALFAAVGVTAVAAAAVVVVPLVSSPPSTTVDPAVVTAPANSTTVLLAGLDPNGHTDSVVLARIGGSGSAVVSLPRDLWVDVPGRGMGKLNSAYVAGETGEPQDLVRTVEGLTGVHVDHYAMVDMATAGRLSDVVGGVEVCLVNPARESLSGVDLPAGKSTLSGDQALAFLRQRHGLPNGDFDRVVRQQAFLRSLAAKLLDPAVIGSKEKVGEIVNAVSAGVHTDPDWDLVGFATSLSPNTAVRTATIPTGPEVIETTGGAALSADPTTIRQFVADFLPDRPVATSVPGSADGTGGCVS
jgi:LCP family protein required for cell wall assembly